ncbi:MAG: hypothetical protein ACK5LP_07755 [Campylobacteraceae bacterium]
MINEKINNYNTRKLVKNLATVVESEARSLAPVVKGTLKQSITILSINDNEAIVGHAYEPKLIAYSGQKVIYPLFVHEGTAPYTIVPKKKKALHWKEARYPIKKVSHPGIKANPYFTKALSSKKIDECIEEFANELIEEISLSLGDLDK